MLPVDMLFTHANLPICAHTEVFFDSKCVDSALRANLVNRVADILAA